MKKIIAILLFGAILFLLSCVDEPNDVSPDHAQAVTYPKAIAFDDYDAKRKLVQENPIDDHFIKAINHFTYDTSQVLLKDEGGQL